MVECSAPGSVTEDDLLAAAEGAATPAVLAHLAQCARCASVALGYAQTQRLLAGALFRLDCPSSLDLAEYVAGVLTATQRQTVAAHLVDCVPCTADVALLRAEQRQEQVAPTPVSGLRRLIAQLVAPAPAPGLAGLRGGLDDGLQVYTAGNLLVALDVLWDATNQYGEISGLLTTSDGGPLPADVGVALRRAADGGVSSAFVDAMATFSFADLAMGQYQLDLTSDDQLITIEGINVSADALS